MCRNSIDLNGKRGLEGSQNVQNYCPQTTTNTTDILPEFLNSPTELAVYCSEIFKENGYCGSEML